MKILLLGDCSSLHKFLKDGLLKIHNVEVTLASTGDGFKKIGGADVALPVLGNKGLFSRIIYYIKFMRTIRSFKGYDVVQLIHVAIIPPLIWKQSINYLFRNNKKVFLVAAGLDYALVKAYNSGKFEYNIFDSFYNGLKMYSNNNTKGRLMISNETFLINKVYKVIPSLYEYSVGYDSNKVSDVVPFPINLSGLVYKKNIVGEKVVFFHGLLNEEKKGTKYIKEALIRLQNNYPDDVEVIIKGHMPYSEYLTVLEKANIVVDQCMTYGYGINACISMAQGKVVMSGARHETLNSFGVESCPIICIKPDAGFIYEKLEWIVNNKTEIARIGKESREYIENVHDLMRNTQKYLTIWSES